MQAILQGKKEELYILYVFSLVSSPSFVQDVQPIRAKLSSQLGQNSDVSRGTFSRFSPVVCMHVSRAFHWLHVSL